MITNLHARRGDHAGEPAHGRRCDALGFLEDGFLQSRRVGSVERSRLEFLRAPFISYVQRTKYGKLHSAIKSSDETASISSRTRRRTSGWRRML